MYAGLEGIVLNEMVSIRVKGNPIPFAVGLSLVSWEGIQSNGMRGRAVRVLHYFGDMLCYKWNRNAPINDGFSLSRIGALSGYVEPMGYVDEVEAGLKIGDIGLADDMEADADAPADSIDTKIQPIKDEIHDIALHNLHPDNRLPADECVMSAADTIGGPLDSPSISDTEMDLALEICMLRALYYVVKDKHLPMLVSSLWSVSLR